MHRYLSLKKAYRKIFDFGNYKILFRNKTSKTFEEMDQSSECMVTEEQIQKDNLEEDPPSPPFSECCEEGCQNCVWLEYVIKLKYYTKYDKQKIKEAIDLIPNIDVKTFVALELKKKDGKS